MTMDVPELVRSKKQREAFNTQTHSIHADHDAINSYFNHRQVYIDCFQKDWYTLRKLVRRIGADIGTYLRFKLKNVQSGALQDAENERSGAAIVIASGASLDDAIPHLKNWEGGIVSSTSQYATLMYHGIAPDYIVSFDSKMPVTHLSVPKHNYKKTTLICRPDNNKEFLDAWRGRKLYTLAKSDHPLYHDIMPAAFPWIGHIYPFACTPPAQISAAMHLGYNALWLVGADLAYIDGKVRHTEHVWKNKKWHVVDWHTVRRDARHDVIVEGYQTSTLHEFYREQILMACWLEDGAIGNCSPGLLQDYLPYVPIEEVVQRNGMIYGAMGGIEVRRQNIGAFLFGRGIYWMPTPTGFLPFTFDDEAEIQEFAAEKLSKDYQRQVAKDIADLRARYEKTQGKWPTEKK